MKGFDEWYFAKYGWSWEERCGNLPVAEAMRDLSREMRAYVSDIFQKLPSMGVPVVDVAPPFPTPHGFEPFAYTERS